MDILCWGDAWAGHTTGVAIGMRDVESAGSGTKHRNFANAMTATTFATNVGNRGIRRN